MSNAKEMAVELHISLQFGSQSSGWLYWTKGNRMPGPACWLPTNVHDSSNIWLCQIAQHKSREGLHMA